MKRVVPTDFPTDPLVTEPEALGVAIRAGRTQAGLKLEDAAAALGMAVKTLSAIEAGKPGVELGNVLRACVALGVDLFALPRTRREVVRARLAGLNRRTGSA